ncbi:tyrosine-type recombinase/integrase [Sphingomonas paucimobilis]|uniref:tyrosine-type recombinase/integrase n=1 Tax=Sphingomonas paucimobilis TaxID=13689 RepID=UPI001D1326ED|nr:site-specific integrase [Sphingomonas paucimobilis]
MTITEPGMHADGSGLYLRVRPNGTRSWIFVAIVGGRRREMGLGVPMDVSLAQARELATDVRRAFAQGRDPIAERATAKLKSVPAAVSRGEGVSITFWAFADQLIEDIEEGFKNEKHRKQWRSTLKTHAKGLCNRRLDEIVTDDIVAVLKPIWLKLPETASRVRGRIERVLDAAKVAGHRSGDNPARWKGHLELLLPRKPKKSKEHHAALAIKHVPRFMADLRGRPATAARALEFTILTAARSGETVGMKWKEIDFDERLWTVPADRMKAGEQHVVPLCEAAIAILLAVRPKNLDPEAYVFPGLRGGMMSNMAMAMLLRRMGQDSITVHGFRSAFRDWAGDETNFERETIEMALAHAIESKSEAAYRRARALEKRRELMETWASYCFSDGLARQR